MNLFFSLEKASSFSPVPVPARSVVLAPAAELAVGAGGAARASLRLSLMTVVLGQPGRCWNEGWVRQKVTEGGRVRFTLL